MLKLLKVFSCEDLREKFFRRRLVFIEFTLQWFHPLWHLLIAIPTPYEQPSTCTHNQSDGLDIHIASWPT